MSKKYAKTPTIYQMEATECGAASVAMVMAYYGKYVPLDKVRVDTGVSRDGCKASKMMKGARGHGFEAKGFRMELDKLLKADVPCIIHWNFNHFVVFEGAKGNYFYINDPAQGRRKLTYDELNAAFTGVALFLKPGPDFVKTKKENGLLDFVKLRLAGQYQAMLALLLLGICLVFPGIFLPVFSQIVIDDILVGGNTGWLKPVLIAMLGTVLFQAAFTFYRDKLLVRLQNKMAMLSAHGFLRHLYRLPMFFFDQRYAGDLAGRVDNNDTICEFIGGELIKNVLNVLVSLFYLILLFLYSPLLTAIGVVVLAIDCFVMWSSSDWMSRSVMKMQQDLGSLNGVLMAGINIISTLKAAGVENEYIGRVLGYHAKYTRMEQQQGKLQQAVNALPELMDQLLNVLVLMAGGCLVIRGNLTAGMLVAFNSLLGSFMAPVKELLQFAQKIQTVKADMSRVDDILRYSEDEVYANRPDSRVGGRKLSGEIELRDIAFGYSRLEPPLVEHFDFHLGSGRSIAFVGASGSGKSTVSKIISGLYLPWQGEILVDDVPLKNVGPEIISASISTVSQDITLFSGTVKENITMWNSSIRDEDIIRAAKDACIHDVITKKPGAYEYRLTEGGRNLSGGQRQRLEIARALVTNPTILVMDEATSALDVITEKEIVDNIRRRGCTCIIVAHRLSAIRDCDQIIVMDQGKIVQRGTHETLVNQPGHYQRLVTTM